MGTNSKLDMDECGPLVNKTMYKGIIGSLLYLIGRHLNIAFSVGIYAKFQSKPKASHWKATERVLRCLNKTWELVLYYPTGDSFKLIGYTNVDYAGYQVDRNNTSGMAHFLGLCLISWGTKK